MLEVTFDKDRETKNTVRFEERAGEDPPMVGTLYLQRWALRRLGDPTVLRVQIDADETVNPARETSDTHD